MARTVARVDPAALVYGLPAPSDPQVSPDGSRLLYALAVADRETPDQASIRLYTCAFDGSNPRPLLEGGRNDTGGRWSPDGRWIAFVSERIEKASGLFLVSADGGDARLVSQHRRPISAIAWAPDSRSIAYSAPVDAADPDESGPALDGAPVVRVTRRLDYKLDGRGYLDDLRNQVFVVGLDGGERRRLTSWPREHAGATWSPDGRRLAIVSARTRSAQLMVADVRSGEMRMLGPDTGPVGLLAWSPDSSRLLLAADPGRSYQLDWWLWDGQSLSLIHI